MITPIQFEMIAKLSAMNFRFENSYGQTIVVFEYPNGCVNRLHEDGTWLGLTPSGNTWIIGIETFSFNDIPELEDLKGKAPDATGDLSSEEFVRRIRDVWDEQLLEDEK